MKSASIATILIVAGAAHGAILSENQYQFLFSKYATSFNKTYDVKDVVGKYVAFKENIDFILEHNRSNSTFTLGVNQFADMTLEEFSNYANLNKVLADAGRVEDSEPIIQEQSHEAPSSADWTHYGPPIESQGECGSCWAFATTATYSSHFSIRSQIPGLLLSNQQLVDCDTKSFGCDGGFMSTALDWIKSNNGICYASQYPYTARQGTCRDGCNKIYKPFSIRNVRTENELNNVLAMVGPVAVGIDASSRNFQFYLRGILSYPGTNLNHGVVAIGFGSENGVVYNKLRNSWGTTWGENGYFRIAHGRNTLAIADSMGKGMAVYPQM